MIKKQAASSQLIEKIRQHDAQILPGDYKFREKLANNLRVNYAGETGAVDIYETQYDTLHLLNKTKLYNKFSANKAEKTTQLQQTILEMLEQERRHYSYFHNLMHSQTLTINDHCSKEAINWYPLFKPTAMHLFWKIGAKLLGVTSVLLGQKAILLTTEAIEKVIVEHYQEQLDWLELLLTKSSVTQHNMSLDKLFLHDIRQKISEFCADELEHQHTAASIISDMSDSINDNNKASHHFSDISIKNLKRPGNIMSTAAHQLFFNAVTLITTIAVQISKKI